MSNFRGAPFDKNNLFSRDAVDGGKTVRLQGGANFTRIDGGTFTQTPPEINDCGLLPKEGEATYVPDPDYGPDGARIGLRDG